MINLIRLLDQQEAIDLVNKDELYKDIFGLHDNNFLVPNLIFKEWYKVIENDTVIGIIILSKMTTICVSFHGGMYIEYRHKDTASKLKSILDSIKKDSGCVFITTINHNNLPAIALVKSIGFNFRGRIKNGYENGDMLIFGEKSNG